MSQIIVDFKKTPFGTPDERRLGATLEFNKAIDIADLAPAVVINKWMDNTIINVSYSNIHITGNQHI
jgi:hypothetical protein